MVKARPTVNKRLRERSRQEKLREKAAKKEERKRERAEGAPVEDGVDPDIAHIVPGPQPLDPELFGIPDEEEESEA